MALVLGITGGIGSGKSTVCQVFRLLGAPVFEADAVARGLMESDNQLITALTALVGKAAYTPDGKLNRELLAAALFSNHDLREAVNRLVHPAVHASFYRWLEVNAKAPYVVYEAAILFEGGFHRKMDFSIVVAAPETDRIARVVKRSGITEAMVLERMKSQWPEEKKRELADRCLENDNKHLLLPEIVQIDKKLKTDGTIW